MTHLNKSWYLLKLTGILIVFTAAIYSQTFDPLTGELIVPASDSLSEKSLPKASPKFDPFTGELLPPDDIQAETNKPITTMPKIVLAPKQATPANSEQAMELSAVASVCTRAKANAVAETSPLWYVGGVIYFIGVPINFLVPPEPKLARINQLSPADAFIYRECYINSAKAERTKRMSSGCVAILGLNILLAL